MMRLRLVDLATLRRVRLSGLAGMFLALVVALPARAECPIPAAEFQPDPTATSQFLRNRCKFRATGVNPYFVLVPGYQLVLESDEEVAVITVLDETRRVDGVRTRVVEELAFEKDGDERILVERSLNYYAICKQTNAVFYFGEDVEFFDADGNVIASSGAWRAGRNGAEPGIIMPGTILLGGKYYEEIAPEDSALDKAAIVAIDDGCDAGNTQFDAVCVTTVGTNDCNDDVDEKLYVAGIGVVADDDLVLVSHGFVDDDHDDEADD